jgi:hypothetical protein
MSGAEIAGSRTDRVRNRTTINTITVVMTIIVLVQAGNTISAYAGQTRVSRPCITVGDA